MHPVHRVFLIPGMFGFGRLAGYDYFLHLENELEARFREAHVPVILHVIPTPPTASIRRRAEHVARVIAKAAGADDGPIHLLGHSTGGLDARLVMSPSTRLELPPDVLEWRSRVRTVLTLNTPHYGTPLASYFTTVSGTRLLYAVSLFTVTTLSLGRPPLSALSSLVAAVGTLDQNFGAGFGMLESATEKALRVIGDQSRDEVASYLDGIRHDQGGILQITPECMDLFNSVAEDDPNVFYGSIASGSPPPSPLRFARNARSPFAVFSSAAYAALYQFSSRPSARYPHPRFSREIETKLHAALGRVVDDVVCDGVVPTRSMVWGELLWAGKGDHLDVVGHFKDDDSEEAHIDWMTSGASFGRYRFRTMVDALARPMLGSARADEHTLAG
jgi:triacylglycerol lipase